MEAAEKGLTESGASMSKKQSENDGDEVVVEVQIEDMEDGAPGSCLKGGLESSSSNQVSKVSSPLNSPEITSFCNPLIPDKGKSSSLGHMALDSDVLEEEGDIEEIGSPSNNSPHKEVEVDEEDEDMVMKFSSSRKVKKKKVLTLMEWIILACSLGVLVASFTVKKLENHKAWGLEMWKWCVIVMLSFCGILVTNWVLTLLVFVIERNFLFMMKDKIYLVHRVKRSVQVFLWLGMVLLTWLFFFKFNRGGERSETTTKILDHIMWTLVSLLIGAFLWMLSTLLFKSLASKFMAVAYFDRIQESLFNQYVIETLSGPPILEGAEIRRSLSTGFASLRRTYSVEKKVTSKVNVSVETMDTLVGAVSTRNDGIRSESKAKAAAVQIFQNVAMHGYKYIEEEDLMRFLDREEVDRVLPLIEGAMENGRIKRNDLETWMRLCLETLARMYSKLLCSSL